MRKMVLFWLAGLAFCIGCSDRGNPREILTIPGTGASEEILKKLAQAYMEANPGWKVVIPESIGSGGGVKAVGNDEYILGRVSRPIKESEKELGLSYIPFAKDAVVFVVGDSVKADSLTSQQILDIYSDRVANWSELGLDSAPIRALAREKGETSYSIIDEHFSAFAELKMSEKAKIAYHDYEMVDLVCKYPTSIGWLTSSSVKNGINPISFDGVAPTTENVRSGKYPFVAEYAFIYKEKRLNESARKFMEFVFSGQGRKILESNGLSTIDEK